MGKCYGKIPSVLKAGREFFGASQATGQLPAPPAAIQETAGLQFQEFGNTRIGDCTCAELGNQILAQTFLATGTPVIVPEADVINFYSSVSGYDPGSGANDNGADEDAVVAQFERAGLGGYKALGSVNVDPRNAVHLMQARWVYGGFALGLRLPSSAEQQFDAGQPWTVPWFSPIAGLHEIFVCDFDQSGLYVVSWGRRFLAAWDFIFHYAIDAHAMTSTAYLRADGTTPGHLTADQLLVDQSAVAG